MNIKTIREALKDYSRITGKAEAALGALDALEEAHVERCELAEAIAEGDKDALERLAQMACDERNEKISEEDK